MAKKSVLLVEDEVLLCWVLEDAVAACGYAVQTSTTGDQGMAALETDGPFDALLTNIKLPDGPDGFALARHARKLDPSIAVLYVSGDSVGRHGAEGVEGSKMLAKPFDPEHLCETLSSLMDSGQPLKEGHPR
jgi:DNA-binding response OmpR family regulator